MSRSSDPHQPLKQTIDQVKSCARIMRARLSNGALVRNPATVSLVNNLLSSSEQILETAFKILFHEDM